MKPIRCLAPITLCLFTGCVPMIIMNSMDRDNYSKYVQATNQLNTDREKSGLQPVHVLTFEEWKGK